MMADAGDENMGLLRFTDNEDMKTENTAHEVPAAGRLPPAAAGAGGLADDVAAVVVVGRMVLLLGGRWQRALLTSASPSSPPVSTSTLDRLLSPRFDQAQPWGASTLAFLFRQGPLVVQKRGATHVSSRHGLPPASENLELHARRSGGEMGVVA